MSIDAIKTVAVLGAGTMGNGIAHVFARCGYIVILRDVEESFLARARDTMRLFGPRKIASPRITGPNWAPYWRMRANRREHRGHRCTYWSAGGDGREP